MVDVGGDSLYWLTHGLVWGLAASIRWTGWTLTMALVMMTAAWTLSRYYHFYYWTGFQWPLIICQYPFICCLLLSMHYACTMLTPNAKLASPDCTYRVGQNLHFFNVSHQWNRIWNGFLQIFKPYLDNSIITMRLTEAICAP